MRKEKKREKIILAFLLLIYICLSFKTCSQAIDLSSLGKLDDYGQVVGNSDAFMDKVGKVITVVQTVGSIASVICLIVIGVKYMTGSVEEKAEYKKTLVPYVIGAALIFSITNLLSIVYHIALLI